MIAGSFASTVHGFPRSTQDIDIVIDPSHAELETLLGSVSPEAYYVDSDAARDAFRRRSMFNLIDLASGWKVDLIFRKNRAGVVATAGASLDVAYVERWVRELELTAEWDAARATEL